MSVLSGNSVLKKKQTVNSTPTIEIKVIDKHEPNNDKALYYYVLMTININLQGNTTVYLTISYSHTHQHQLLFLSCVSVSHLT